MNYIHTNTSVISYQTRYSGLRKQKERLSTSGDFIIRTPCAFRENMFTRKSPSPSLRMLMFVIRLRFARYLGMLGGVEAASVAVQSGRRGIDSRSRWSRPQGQDRSAEVGAVHSDSASKHAHRPGMLAAGSTSLSPARRC